MPIEAIKIAQAITPKAAGAASPAAGGTGFGEKLASLMRPVVEGLRNNFLVSESLTTL